MAPSREPINGRAAARDPPAAGGTAARLRPALRWATGRAAGSNGCAERGATWRATREKESFSWFYTPVAALVPTAGFRRWSGALAGRRTWPAACSFFAASAQLREAWGDDDMRLHTHYDNLKVTRDAPPEVIRAAYHALSRKYHPDLHQGDPDAERAMALINAAYEALSDPLRKGDHDAWIARAEAELERGGGMPASAPGGAHDRTSAPWSRLPRVRLFFGAAVTVAAVAIGIALVGGRSRQYTAEGSADAARPRSDSGVTGGPPRAASAPAR